METLTLLLALTLAAETIFILFYKKKYENKDQQVSALEQQLTDANVEITRLSSQISAMRQTYEPIINVDEAIDQRRKILFENEDQITAVKADYVEKRAFLKSLEEQIRIYENNLNDISYGLYAPVYNYDSSAQYKEKLESIRDQQRSTIKNETAVYCATEWTVSGSRVESIRMTKQYAKLMLRAFNGESDSIIARVSWNNIGNMEARVFKAFELINKLGTTNQISITSGYLDLKLAELRLEFELQEKLHAEKGRTALNSGTDARGGKSV